MKTYRITIGKYTRKEKFEAIEEVFVNSKNNKNDVEAAYRKKYSPLFIKIEEVKCIEIFNEKEIKEIKETNIKYSDVEHSSGYTAYVKNEDIESYSDLIEPVIDAERELKKEEKVFKEKITEQFGLKGLETFNRVWGGVRFTFKPHQFKFTNLIKK